MIHINKIEKKYSSEFSLYIESLDIQKGERVALIGSNGSGKSTLMKIMGGVLKADTDDSVIDCDKSSIGYEPQAPFCYNMNLRKNVLLGITDKRLKADSEKAADDIIEKCCLSHLISHKPSALSGGEKQRMCFARMLVRPYSLLLLDEPLSAVDIELSEQMENVLLSYCIQNNTTLLFSTHLPSQAIRLSTKMIIMHNGRIAEFGRTEDIVASPKTEFGKKFLSNWSL